MSPFVKIGLFDRIRLYFLRKWTSGYVLVFRPSGGKIGYRLGLWRLSIEEHRALCKIINEDFLDRDRSERIEIEAELAVKALIS